MEPFRNFFDALFNDNSQLGAPYEVPPFPPWHTGTLGVSLLSVMLLMPYHHLSDKVQLKLSKISDSSLDFPLHPTAVKNDFPAMSAHFEQSDNPESQRSEQHLLGRRMEEESRGLSNGHSRAGGCGWDLVSLEYTDVLKGDLFSDSVMEKSIEA